MSELDIDAVEGRLRDFNRTGMGALENVLLEDDLPALVAEVRRLRVDVGNWEAAAKRCADRLMEEMG